MVTIDITSFCGASACWNTEVLACKIAQYKNEKIVLDLRHEGWDIVENGIEHVVKNICDELNIPYTLIEFISSDRLCKSKIFKHTATNERLYSFSKHKNWQYSNRGRASLHLDISTAKEWNCDYTSFICEHNDLWQNLVPVLPYSDIDSYIKPPIILGNSNNTDMWEKVYGDLAIEIVVETNQTPDTFFITEKTFRPITYGKLFLVIGSPLFEQNLKNLGFDIFDDIIDKSYDSESSYIRVDAVFKSLSELLCNPVDTEALLPRLLANKRVLENL